MTVPYPYVDTGEVRWVIVDRRDGTPLMTMPWPGIKLPHEALKKATFDSVKRLNEPEGWERFVALPLGPDAESLGPWAFAPGWFRQLENPPPRAFSSRKRNAHSPESDAAAWAELEQLSMRGVAGEGGGAERSTREWLTLQYPLFPDVVANELLQVLDDAGGEGIRFAAPTVTDTLARRVRIRRSTLIRGRLASAIRALQERRFVEPVHNADPMKWGRQTKVYRFTKLGSEAALAARVVPRIRSGEAVVASSESVGDLFEREEAAFARRAERRATSSGTAAVVPAPAPSRATPDVRALLEERQRRAGELLADARTGQLSADAPAAWGVLPWRTFTQGSPAFDALALSSGQMIHYRQRVQGPYVVFEAWDASPYLLGAEFLVGELYLRPAKPIASVAWMWVHPEFDDPEGLQIVTELHEHAAQEADRRGLQLASGLERGPSADAFWTRQVKKKRATYDVYEPPGGHGLSTIRYLLQYPAPSSLANPHQVGIRRANRHGVKIRRRRRR